MLRKHSNRDRLWAAAAEFFVLPFAIKAPFTLFATLSRTISRSRRQSPKTNSNLLLLLHAATSTTLWPSICSRWRRGEFWKVRAQAFIQHNAQLAEGAATRSTQIHTHTHSHTQSDCELFRRLSLLGCTSAVRNTLVTWLSPRKREVRHVRDTLLYAKWQQWLGIGCARCPRRGE